MSRRRRSESNRRASGARVEQREWPLIWLEAYEKMLDGVFKLEEGTAKDLSSDWVEKFVPTQADFIRATSQAYLGAFKDRLK